MKLKRLPEDFQVKERTDFALDGGRFAFYQLSKTSLGTPEAIAAIGRRWKLRRGQISFGGLKDKHAATRQFLTIENGPKRGLREERLELQYLGQASRPYESRDILSNGFHITLRDLSTDDQQRIAAAADEVKREGTPNYFDDQRFGSQTSAGEFMAEAWRRGDYETALRRVLVEPQSGDTPRLSRLKAELRSAWGDWRACRSLGSGLPQGQGAVFDHLFHRPGDYRGAITRIPAELRSIYLAAYQSFLWNRLLAAYLIEHVPAANRCSVELASGQVPFYRGLDESLRQRLLAETLPLPSARLHLDPGPTKAFIDRILAELGTELRELRVKYPRDSFFSKGDRALAVLPASLSLESADDELHPGRLKVALAFDLPRGAYATIVVKRLTAL